MIPLNCSWAACRASSDLFRSVMFSKTVTKCPAWVRRPKYESIAPSAGNRFRKNLVGPNLPPAHTVQDMALVASRTLLLASFPRLVPVSTPLLFKSGIGLKRYGSRLPCLVRRKLISCKATPSSMASNKVRYLSRFSRASRHLLVGISMLRQAQPAPY